MRKIRSFCLIWIIIMTFLMWTGCAKTTGGAADTSQGVESAASGQSQVPQEVESAAPEQSQVPQEVETAAPGQSQVPQEVETAAPGQSESTQELKTEFEAGGESIKLIELSLLSDQLSLLIPDSFDVMSDEIAELKYPTDHRPTLIYTNDDASVNIALNYTDGTATETQIDAYLTLFKQTFQNTYPSAEWYDSGVVEINSKKVGYLELLSQAVDTKIYNLIWFTDLDGRLLLTTFNCTKAQMDDWKPIAKTIMDSQQYS